MNREPITVNRELLTDNRERILTFLALVISGNSVSAAETSFPTEGPQALNFANVMQWSIGLFVVLVAIFICAWLLRKLSGFSSLAGGKLRVLGGISLGGREKVVLLQIEGKQLLLGVAPGSVQTLCVFEKSSDIPMDSHAHESRQPPSFIDRLADAVQHNQDDKT